MKKRGSKSNSIFSFERAKAGSKAALPFLFLSSCNPQGWISLPV